MPVLERTEAVLPPEALDLPEVEYPQEIIDWLEKEVEIAEMQIASGELVPQTAAEMAAEWGIKLE